jgi:hypothetical protein
VTGGSVGEATPARGGRGCFRCRCWVRLLLAAPTPAAVEESSIGAGSRRIGAAADGKRGPPRHGHSSHRAMRGEGGGHGTGSDRGAWIIARGSPTPSPPSRNCSPPSRGRSCRQWPRPAAPPIMARTRTRPAGARRGKTIESPRQPRMRSRPRRPSSPERKNAGGLSGISQSRPAA